MPDSQPKNGFPNYKFFILTELKRHDDWLRHLDKKVEAQQLKILSLSIKVSLIAAGISFGVTSAVIIAATLLGK